MQKRIAILILTLCLLLPVHALATDTSAAPFSRTKIYDGRFQDVTEDSAFYENVAALYEYGLTVGRTGNTYAPNDYLTVGQTAIFAGRVHSLYHTGDPELGAAAFRTEGMPAAIPYLLYLQSKGILGDELGSGSLGVPTTRAQMAHILANLLPEDFLQPINDVAVTEGYARRLYITDVTEYTPYFYDILKLYRCGVLQGSDANGSFYPDSSITRGAAAAMLTRLMDPTLRITLDWDLHSTYTAAGTTYGELVPPGRYIAAPSTETEMDLAIRYMLSREDDFLSLKYPSLDETSAREVLRTALHAVKHYCEQSYNRVTCSYNYNGAIFLQFGITAEGEPLFFRQQTLERAIEVHDRLWAEGTLSSTMTQSEKARVLFDWICENAEYDHAAGNNSISHLAYGLFEHGTAVCDGYTSAYNLLLRLEGIECTALGNDEHLWTVANLDGGTYHIDTTWADLETGPDYELFAMTSWEAYRLHPW